MNRRRIPPAIGRVEYRFVDSQQWREWHPTYDQMEAILSILGKADELWRPIDTAPRGEDVQCFRPDAGVFVARLVEPMDVMSEEKAIELGFEDGFEEWWSFEYGWLEKDLRPTLWRPMAVPPA